MELLPIAVLGYLLIALVWPTWRTWRRTRVFPVVFHREAETAQRVVGALLGLFLAALAAWSLLCAWLEPGRLGILPLAVEWHALGWLLFLGGLVITHVAQAQMGASWRIGIDDRPTQLVTGGLFALSRNPIFSGMFLTLAGIVLIAPAAWVLIGGAVALVLVSLQVRLEERHLVAIHGCAYLSYAARVGRFVPWLGRLRPRGESRTRDQRSGVTRLLPRRPRAAATRR
jgi:protein-S-isoprenylcysteine O-methyltransferase Ste14